LRTNLFWTGGGNSPTKEKGKQSATTGYSPQVADKKKWRQSTGELSQNLELLLGSKIFSEFDQGRRK
jgi:hypothetical protein